MCQGRSLRGHFHLIILRCVESRYSLKTVSLKREFETHMLFAMNPFQQLHSTQEDSGVASPRVYSGGLCRILPGRILTCGHTYSVHDVVGSY